MPAGVAFGWYEDGNLAEVGRILVKGGSTRSSIAMRLHSPDGTTKTISFRCNGGLRKDLIVGPAVLRARLPVAAGGVRDCWFGITRGTLRHVGRFNFSVKGSINLERRWAELRRVIDVVHRLDQTSLRGP